MIAFPQVGNYKKSVKRVDDGNRLCNELMNCIHERARIEKAYAQQLTEWGKRWRQLVEKGRETTSSSFENFVHEERSKIELFPSQALSTELWSEHGRLCAQRRRRWASSTWKWKQLWWEKTSRSWRTGRKTPTTNRWSVASKKRKKLKTASAKLRSHGPKNSKRFGFQSFAARSSQIDVQHLLTVIYL